MLIGSDLPGVTTEHIAEALEVLGRRDVVFGPAEDGGFWLVGVKPLPRLGGLFRNVRWSSPHALTDTLRNLNGRRVGYAATLCDLDDAAAYARLAAIGSRATGGQAALRMW